ncbi:hypothetical protein SAMN05660477_00596 [Soonwooa buanensis]|uniref:Major Facilitator Superfamily protein n=1 Tax=Soonwooa buanensis TaxID=619805 RepID=A0A1T5D421_9FLAO|nr:hypothetical protein [Soonwooa buanensis]SKB66409.1 hypothetical protein SAMN05660477_00596 [Soonwooa buanensis]
MSHNTIYHKWVPQWLKLPLLIMAMFPHLMLMSLFHSNSAFTSSFLDVDSDDLQYLLMLMYGTIVVTLLVLPRFLAYFSVKYYILLMSSVSIIILYVVSVTNNYHVILVMRFLEGIFGVLEGAIFLPLITAELKTKHARIVAYLFLYAIMLTGGTITTSLLKTSIENYNFQHMVLMIVYFHIFVLIVAFSIFNTNRFFAKIPLYQLDHVSCFLLWLSLQSGAYAIIYGKRLMWLESNQIVFCLFLFMISSGLFILKQKYSKRPIFHLEVFSYVHILVGILLFFIFYVIRAGLNNVYSIMANVWKWPWEYINNIQYFNVGGTILGILISGILLVRAVSSKTIFASGFAILAIDCAWFTYVFYPDTTLWTIAPPLFLQGIGQGLLFTPLVMYIITGLPPNLVSNGAVMGTTVRFWTTAIGYSIMQNAILYLSLKHADSLSMNFSPTNPIFSTLWNSNFNSNLSKLTYNDAVSVTIGGFKSKISAQALLLSNMEIFTILFWIALATTIIILLYKPAKIGVRNIFY